MQLRLPVSQGVAGLSVKSLGVCVRLKIESTDYHWSTFLKQDYIREMERMNDEFSEINTKLDKLVEKLLAK